MGHCGEADPHADHGRPDPPPPTQPRGEGGPIQAALRERQLTLPEPVTTAYAAAVTAHARLIIALNEQIAALEEQVKAHFLAHPDAEIYLSMPGIGEITGARVLAEFGDDPTRYASAKARKLRRDQPRHPRLRQELHHSGPIRPQQPSRRCPPTPGVRALQASPGARRYYDKQRARDVDYNPALRQVGNRLVGILHGCLKTRTRYDERPHGRTTHTSKPLDL